MLFFILNFTLHVLARQIEIEPKSTFEFYDYVSKGEQYKFYYNTESDVEVSLLDPVGREIYRDTVKYATLFTNIKTKGKIKISITNKSNTTASFSYNPLEVKKEFLGNPGYEKNANLVSELTRLLDQLIKAQREQIERTAMQQKMIVQSRKWVKTLIFFEALMTGIGVYIMHKSFVAMFEKKQNI